MAQPLVSGQLIYPLEISLPTVSAQERFAANLNEQMTGAEQIQQTIDEQLDAINKLPAALLRGAFNGQL